MFLSSSLSHHSHDASPRWLPRSLGEYLKICRQINSRRRKEKKTSRSSTLLKSRILARPSTPIVLHPWHSLRGAILYPKRYRNKRSYKSSWPVITFRNNDMHNNKFESSYIIEEKDRSTLTWWIIACLAQSETMSCAERTALIYITTDIFTTTLNYSIDKVAIPLALISH